MEWTSNPTSFLSHNLLDNCSSLAIAVCTILQIIEQKPIGLWRRVGCFTNIRGVVYAATQWDTALRATNAEDMALVAFLSLLLVCLSELAREVTARAQQVSLDSRTSSWLLKSWKGSW